jgi:iron complex transport system permease protein
VLLQAADLRFGYPHGPPVIDGVSLAVDHGAVVGILGPNGSGKTTLLRLLSGELRPGAGTIQLDGVDLARVPRRVLARRLAVVPQETELAFDYTALEMVLMGRYPHLGAFEVEGPDDLAAAFAALDATGTRALAERPYRTLSGGERQRVTIASALAQLDSGTHNARSTPLNAPRTSHDAPRTTHDAPSLLFLDEPTASLDLRYQLEVAALLRRLMAARPMTLLVSTHDLHFARAVCTHVVLLSQGRVLAQGDLTSVLTPALVGGLYGLAPALVAPLLDARDTRGRVSPVENSGDTTSAKSPEFSTGETRPPVTRDTTSAKSPEFSTGETRPPVTKGLPMVVLCGVAMVVAIFAAPFIGSTALHFSQVFSRTIPFDDNLEAQIFFVARLPRALAAALVGSTLAAAGVVFQGLLRNPLATPYTLGVSAGASLGAMIAITLGAALPVGGVATASLAGAVLAVLVVYALASAKQHGLSTTVLLLAGVTLNAFFSALILFVQYLSDFAETYRAIRWLMGDLDVASYAPIVAALPLVAVAWAAFAWLARPLNLLSLGAEAAATRGLAITRAQRVAFFGASLATGAAVSVGGPIGFVGIIVPHLVRLLVGADHRLVLPASAGFGAAFLVVCDALARTVLAPLELPVGIITAVIGGPFFLWLLLRKR